MSSSELFPVEALSVGRFLQRVKNAVIQEFRGAFWIEGEVQNVRQFQNSLYITLVEHAGGTRGADVKCDVAVYPDARKVMNAQLNDSGLRLAAGMMVRIYGEIQLSRTGTAQVKLLRLDTDAIVGNKALEKRRIIQSLEGEGLLRANAAVQTPLVPLRICLVTSENSEGHKDFMGQLNASPFAFDVQLCHSQVQGPNAPGQLASAISKITSDDCDLICVVRGGGGELDAFDKEVVARAIANAPRPVWTGIGHTGDRSIADEVASVSCITPTDCGHRVVGRVGTFVQNIGALARRLGIAASHNISRSQMELRGFSRELERVPRQALSSASLRLGHRAEQLGRCAPRVLDQAQVDLQSRKRHIEALSPLGPLRRGYSITRTASGARVDSVTALAAGDELVTRLSDGVVTSVISDTNQESITSEK